MVEIAVQHKQTGTQMQWNKGEKDENMNSVELVIPLHFIIVVIIMWTSENPSQKKNKKL